MCTSTIQALAANSDVNFLPAYVSTILSTRYVLAQNPKLASQILASITTIFTQQTQDHVSVKINGAGSTPWHLADWTMIPISVIMAVSIGSLVRRVQIDGLYAIMLPIAVFGSVGVGWVVDAPVDLVVLAVLPFFLVTALLVVRIKQMLSEVRMEIDRGDEKLEKA